MLSLTVVGPCNASFSERESLMLFFVFSYKILEELFKYISPFLH